MVVDILTRQALITGQVSDAMTGAAPRSRVRLELTRAADGRAVANTLVRVGADGIFVVSGSPHNVLAPQAVTLRLSFAATGYQTQTRLLVFIAADLARVPDAIADGAQILTTPVIAGVPRVLNMPLLPDPVTLRGRVARADDTAQPIAGAEVRLTAPAPLGPVTTDAEGYFTLGPAPVAATVTLSITAAGFDALSQAIRLDFRNPVNTGAWGLEES